MFAALKTRYDALAQRVLSSLSEIERRDVRAFDRWFYANGGWRWLIGVVLFTTFVAWIASNFPWNMSFAEAAILFNLVVLTLIWSGCRRGSATAASRGASSAISSPRRCSRWSARLIGASIAGLVKGVDPFVFFQDSAKLRHVVTAGLVFGVLFALVTALIANLRNREYRALTAHLEAEARQSETSRQLAESKLKLLQLQIEPHFLFNTLGSAQQLAEKGAPDAARLIGELIRFLRAAAPALRDEMTTRAPGSRDDPRLPRHHADAPRASASRGRSTCRTTLADCAIPPGMVITLAENAIKHGIEPTPRGGRVDVTRGARRRRRRARRRRHRRGLERRTVRGRHRARQHPRAAALLYGERRDARARGERAARDFARASSCRAARPRARRSLPKFRCARSSRDEPSHRAHCRRRAADARAAEGQARRGVAGARRRRRGRGRRPGARAVQRAPAADRVPRHPHARARRASTSRPRSARDCHVVFITAYDQYALKAFEAGAVDYL